VTQATAGVVQGFDPRTASPVGAAVAASSQQETDRVVAAAVAAHREWSRWPAARRAVVLRALADAVDAATEELADLADSETALGRPRLPGEVGRTTAQLRLFAEVLDDGEFVGAAISPAGTTAGQPDVRRMLLPIGPVGVFAASNFPFAFSVLGGDTVSALAAGCAVVVKAHEGHPQTSARTYELATAGLAAAGAPDGLLGIIYGRDSGVQLVQHPAIRAVGFTGSLGGGRALFDLAVGRPDPIPFYGELGSVNPVVVLPGAATADPEGIANGYAASLTQGTGQFCTNPGLLFVPEDVDLLAALARAVTLSRGGPMLTTGMRDAYRQRTAALEGHADVEPFARGSVAELSVQDVAPQVNHVALSSFAAHLDELSEEVFGPTGLVITYADPADLPATLARLSGNLTASVHAAESDDDAAAEVSAVLSRSVGRLIYNGWPTGVAVCWAMQHGGPWPATTAPGTTSVGARAIDRWLVPVAYQGWPDALLPPALQAANPLGIVRRTDASVGTR
jgi:NADP-dependent aldehyde dehydrogenase